MCSHHFSGIYALFWGGIRVILGDNLAHLRTLGARGQSPCKPPSIAGLQAVSDPWPSRAPSELDLDTALALGSVVGMGPGKRGTHIVSVATGRRKAVRGFCVHPNLRARAHGSECTGPWDALCSTRSCLWALHGSLGAGEVFVRSAGTAAVVGVRLPEPTADSPTPPHTRAPTCQ